MSEAICFSRDQLRSYVLGDLPETAYDDVASHVEGCVDCEATVSELDRESDTLIESLRQPVVQDEPLSAYRLAAKRAVAQWQDSIDEPTAANSPRPLSDVPRLRDYELLEPIARGGMGTVYRARHLRLNRQVAVKVLPGHWLKSPVVVARFEREMQAVGSLRHPAIVQATDGGEAEGVQFLVMELIDGFDGGGLVRHLGPLRVADACEIARQAAAGMAYVHEQGIIHRDLKPSNLMVTPAGDVKVLDLGLARVVGEQLAEDELTTVGQLMGTLDFMAPEQIENSHEVDERADIYSLGATLYKLLTGCSPHATEPGEPLLSKLRRIATEPPLPLRERRPDVPTELCALVDSMLSRCADDRPASMDAVADSLGVLAQSSDLVKGVTEAVQVRQQRQRSEKSSRKPAKRFTRWEAKDSLPHESQLRPAGGRRLLAGAWAALLLLAVAMGVVITLQTGSGQLVIETASPDVEVRVLKAGQPHRQLTIKQKAQSLRLGAGEYEIEIVSAADGLEIENGIYTLKRGETWLAKIVHRRDARETQLVQGAEERQPVVAPVGDVYTGRVSDEPTYEGKTLAQWLAQLRRERSPKQFYEACRALGKLATGEDTAEAVAALLVATRVHDSRAYYREDTRAPIYLWNTVQSLLASRDQRVVVAEMTTELDRPDEANSEFILSYLAVYHARVRPFVNERVLSRLERLSTNDSSQLRMEALSILQKLGSEEAAARRLVAALSDRDVEVQLSVARMLIEMQSNAPPVVATLRQLVRSGELGERAEAAWLLGDMGAAAKPALPELTAVLQEDSDEVSRAGAYQTPSTYSSEGRARDLGTVSLKDAAIRALAEVGDDSVVPMLTVEWSHRARSRSNSSTPAWSHPGRSVARSYGKDWVADAIEALTGMRPNLVQYNDKTYTSWEVDQVSFDGAYRAIFSRRDSASPAMLDTAKKLLPRSHRKQRERAWGYIRNPNSLPEPGQLELEVKLLELLAGFDEAPPVLEAMFYRWRYYADPYNLDWKPEARAEAVAAYRDCVVRIVQAAEDWQATVVPDLFRLAEKRLAGAGVVLTELLPELDPQQQIEAGDHVLRLIGSGGTQGLEASLKKLEAWLNDATYRDAIHQRLEEEAGDSWEDLMVGLLRSGLAEAAVEDILKARFGEQSVNRRDVVKKLVYSLADQPRIAPLLITLIKHPALDAPASTMIKNGERTMMSLRAAYYIDLLERVPTQHRPAFMPLLRELAEAGKNRESQAASRVLDAWK